MSTSADVTITTVQSIFFFACIIGNALVCAVIKRYRDMRIPINYLLVNLAVADIFFATFQITELIYSHIDTHPGGVAGKAACILRNGSLQWIGACASAFTVAAIAVERYFAVIYPYGNKGKLTMKKLKLIILGSWIVSTIVSLPPSSSVIYMKDINMCVVPKKWIGIVSLVFHSLFISICTILLAGLYSRVVYTLWFKRQEDNILTPQQQGALRVRKRVTLMVFTVSAIFGVCWISDLMTHFIKHFSFSKLSPYAIPVVHTMLMFNAALNPFAYALMSQQFRAKMSEILCGASRSSSARVQTQRNLQDIEMDNQRSQLIDPLGRNHSTT